MAWLPRGEKISKISLFVLAQLTNVTDGQTKRRTNRQTDGHRMPAIAALCIASHGKNATVDGDRIGISQQRGRAMLHVIMSVSSWLQ